MVDWNALHGDYFRQMPVLVTGGAGFIGSHLVDALVALGANVEVLDNLNSGDASNIASGARFQHGDIRDEDALGRCVEGRQRVFHLAALVSVPHSVAHPTDHHDVNGTGTVKVLEASRKARVERVVYSASASAYGDSPELPKCESMAQEPKSPYATAKLVGEGYVSAYAACYEIDAVSLRYFNIFGPRQNPNSPYSGVIAAFSRMILAGQPPRITGDGSASRDFTYVANVVHANLLAARSTRRLGGCVVNVGTGKRVTVLELAQEMTKAFGRADLVPEFTEPRPGDVPHSVASFDRAKSVLGYEPIVGFEQGLAATCAWYRQRADVR